MSTNNHPSANILLQKGEYFFQYGELSNAISCFTKALEIDPTRVNAFNNLGVVSFHAGSFDTAINSFSRGFAIDSKDANLTRNYAGTLLALDSPGAARRIIELHVDAGGDPTSIMDIRNQTDAWNDIYVGTLSTPAVRVDNLHTQLSFDTPLEYPRDSLFKPFLKWHMETDDAPIFRYLYRNFQPRRHLEFGTWQGAGVVYCLEESDATVWTINLPFGEEKPDGGCQYSGDGDSFGLGTSMAADWAKRIGLPKQSSYRTDSFGFIGRFYLEKGLGHRVCQIYCDSRQWDDSAYPDGFFDTILLDGGHTPDVVASDTNKALRLLRPGGLIMWHDFCPPVRNKFAVVHGVMGGVEQSAQLLRDSLEKLFWIEPSWILVGIKKNV